MLYGNLNGRGVWSVGIKFNGVFQKLGYSGQRESTLDVEETGNEKMVD